jgi:hypothetical protein
MRTVVGCIVAGSFFALAAIGVSAQGTQTTSALIGTWKFNPQKSKMVNTLPPRSLTRKYEDRGGGVYVVRQELIDAAGWKTVSLYVAKEDGSDYPLVVSGADDIPAGWISFKRIDAYTTEQVEKVAGGGNAGGADAARVRSRGTRKLSPDGKTMTLTVRTGAGGDDGGGRGGPERDPDILVFDKQ